MESRNDEQGATDGELVNEPRFSTSTQIAAIVGIVATMAAGMLWLAGQRSAANNAGAPNTVAGTNSPSGDSAERAAANAAKPSANPTKSPKKKAPEKPKAIFDTINYSGPGCEEGRNMGVNIIEQRGQVDSVTLVWKSKELDWERSRRIYRDGKQWTGYLQNLPNDVDLHLSAIIKGPGGEITLGTNIARYC